MTSLAGKGPAPKSYLEMCGQAFGKIRGTGHGVMGGSQKVTKSYQGRVGGQGCH